MTRQVEELIATLKATKLTCLPKPEFARGDHIVTPQGLHAIVLQARYSGLDTEWKICVAMLGCQLFKLKKCCSAEIQGNKVSVGGPFNAPRMEMAAARATLLHANPYLVGLAPEHSRFECFASWCRVGQWNPCTVQGNVMAAKPLGKGLPGDGLSMGAAFATVDPAAGIMDFFGAAVWAPLGPILVPLVLGGTAICCAKDYVHKVASDAWDEYGKDPA